MPPALWILALSMLSTTAPPDRHPIRLVAEPLAGSVRLRIVGSSERPLDATYLLEVSSDPAAGGNRSVQRGRAALAPGVDVTLMTLNMSHAPSGRWSARLRVEPQGGEPYEEILGPAPD